MPFAGICFLWFIGVVRDGFGRYEDRFFASVFLGSGLLFLAMVFAASAVGAALVASRGVVESSAGEPLRGSRTSARGSRLSVRPTSPMSLAPTT